MDRPKIRTQNGWYLVGDKTMLAYRTLPAAISEAIRQARLTQQPTFPALCDGRTEQTQP